MKYEWRKLEKARYLPKTTPVILDVPAQRFVSLHGTGNPNTNPAFQAQVQALYAAAYGIKMTFKKTATGDLPYNDYVVFPLEGVWSLTSKGQQLDHLDKNEFSYDLMIRVPDFVPTDLINSVLATVQAKPDVPLAQDLGLKRFAAMQAAEVLHVGRYDDEPASFAKIDQLVAERGLTRVSKVHREIYLSDARRVAPERLRTVLRYQVQ
ncbi:hypothetical protein D1831_08630 [Lactiplantibacillus garii]|uniref:GyrI-like small molecule binding domain-containing protein n=1 Tax=Lactiplantibacillus garii TaxID=2306423 RepID=A0A3R8J6U8_9LACO|nr:GyrI-like domain-containing protein [Lactiplantibacillus garii]RRK10217.1 hypothetical protein D1831_08630 [Lactiplantibacillus garii]